MKGTRSRVVVARHDSCGSQTRIMLPAVLPARVVRRVECSGCGHPFEAGEVTEVRGIAAALPSLPRLDPSSRAWRIASVPIAAALVIAGLLLIQGGDESDRGASPPAAGTPAREAADAAAPVSGGPDEPARGAAERDAAAEVVRGAHYSLALPTGWDKVDPPSGATFSALTASGEAEATLWIEENAGLAFPAFVSQSIRQMEAVSTNPTVCSRVSGPTPETTVVRLCGEAQPEQPSYEVVLRAAGPYRYYLALTVQPDASREAADGVDLIANSLTPEVSG